MKNTILKSLTLVFFFCMIAGFVAFKCGAFNDDAGYKVVIPEDLETQMAAITQASSEKAVIDSVRDTSNASTAKAGKGAQEAKVETGRESPVMMYSSKTGIITDQKMKLEDYSLLSDKKGKQNPEMMSSSKTFIAIDQKSIFKKLISYFDSLNQAAKKTDSPWTYIKH
jgi:hypothetical protein